MLKLLKDVDANPPADAPLADQSNVRSGLRKRTATGTPDVSMENVPVQMTYAVRTG